MNFSMLRPNIPGRAGWSRFLIINLLAILGAGSFITGWIWWLAARNPTIPFLNRIPPAEWIVYPLAPDATSRDAIELATVFRRQWTLELVPTNAILRVRAFGRCQITLNGVMVGNAPRDGENWKMATVYDVARWLHPGANEISAVVANSSGPPALWLSLRAGPRILNSDAAWQASLAGAVWQPAQVASVPMRIRKGNRVAGGERCPESLSNRWPTLLLFTLLSLGVFCAGRHFLRWKTGLSKRQAVVLFSLAAVLWIGLFLHNLRLLPGSAGFDVFDHLKYIEYIQDRHALPLANEGLEMHQPPLYYLLCASILSALRLSTADAAAIATLRIVGLVLGLIQTGLVFACLRLVFPGDARKQIFGLILGVSMPVHLYLYQYVTNEILAATLVTASVYFSLRILKSENPTRALYAWLGLCLGTALLTKITALVVMPVILATLAGQLLVKRERRIWVWLRTVGLTCLVCLVVSGWHYFRVWIHFGNILAGSHDRATGYAWWADPGFGTAAYYFRFGQSLVAPLFSGLNGFVDGIYSTLWGDGLCGGVARLDLRPPWNWDLVTAGYLLAVLPAMAILVGAATSLIALIRRPQPVWFMLCGLIATIGAAMICFPLKYPYHFANAKAFYGLPAMVVVCVFGAWGMDILTRRWRIIGVIFWVGLGTWAMNSYVSVWIQAQAPHTRIVLAQELARKGDYAAAIEMLRGVLKIHPQNAPAHSALARTLEKVGRAAEAQQEYVAAWQVDPNDPDCAASMAYVLAQQGRQQEAVELAEQVVQNAPDMPDVYPLLGRLLSEQGQDDKAITAYQEALRVDPADPVIHSELGRLYLQRGQNDVAVEQLRYALEVRPDDSGTHNNLGLAWMRLHQPEAAIAEFSEALRLSPENSSALANMAWIRATCSEPGLRDGRAAVGFAERACRLTNQEQVAPWDALAAAYAEVGRFSDAIQAAQQAVNLASTTGQKTYAAAIQRRLELYRAGQPFRE